MRGFLVRSAAAAAAVLLLAGCSSPDPQKTVNDAVQATAWQQQSTTTVRLETTPEDLQKLADLAKADSPEDAASISQVVALAPKLSFSMATRVHDGVAPKDAKSLDQIDFAAKIAVDDKPIELVQVKGNWYLRADVAGIGQATDLFTKSQLEMLLAGAKQTPKWLTDFVNGKWVQLDPATAKALLAKAELTGSKEPMTVDNAKFMELLATNSKVTKSGDDTYAVTVDAKALIKGIADLDPNDDFTAKDADEAIADLNDGADLNVTLTIKDGKVTKAVVDLADIIRTWPKPEAGSDGDELRKLQAETFALGLAVEFSDQADIPEPTDATMIPAGELNALLKMLNS